MLCEQHICGYGGMADAQDSKSCGGDFVWVQVPLSALNLIKKTPEIQWFLAFSFTRNAKKGAKRGQNLLILHAPFPPYRAAIQPDGICIQISLPIILHSQ